MSLCISPYRSTSRSAGLRSPSGVAQLVFGPVRRTTTLTPPRPKSRRSFAIQHSPVHASVCPVSHPPHTVYTSRLSPSKSSFACSRHTSPAWSTCEITERTWHGDSLGCRALRLSLFLLASGFVLRIFVSCFRSVMRVEHTSVSTDPSSLDYLGAAFTLFFHPSKTIRLRFAVILARFDRGQLGWGE